MIIKCHPLTRQTLVTEYRSDIIHIDRKSPLLPLMICPPLITKAPLTSEVEIMIDASIDVQIHESPGYNLYEYHMDKLVQYMCRRVDMGEFAWTAMEDIWHTLGLDMDELALDTLYKRWQRFVRKRDEGIKRTNSLKKSPISVLKKLNHFRAPLKECIEEASHLIAYDPDTFMSTQGQPDRFMLKKATMYVMSTRRWKLEEIASQFGETAPNVSVHISSFKSMIRHGQVVIPA